MIKTVLITGGSSGIGFELSKIFGANNYDLVLVAQNAEKLKKSAEELKNKNINVKTIAKDLSDPASPTQIYELLQKESIQVDILVNNAGFATYGPFVETNLEKELIELQVNIVSLTHLTKLFVRDMIKRGNGKILNVASTAAFTPGPLMAVYYASKAYVLSFSEALNEELANSGVSVTALCPGPTDTGFVARGNLQNSKLFQGKHMNATFVAQKGYDGLMKNKTIVIPGLQNKLMVQGLRFAPRSFVTKLVKSLQSKRGD
ncbi:MAG TPA: SDR family oxidoreductase [Candidatus Saccharimonadales bacterium]|nr:SDR family oxidoreductase [Candidatus Saccharimonadales bacterium]